MAITNDVDEHITTLWREAARDLGIALVSPFAAIGPQGESIPALAWLRDFGSPRGAVVCTSDDPRNLSQLALEWGYEIVDFDAFVYPARYDRRLFIGMLARLGWSGPPEHRPAWLDALSMHS
jgi:hypothetical protein